MELDPLLLSRIQFAANVSFHILFPTITIALGWILLFFKLRYSATQDYKWMKAYFFWTKIFALSFAMGVVSGITMSFQFGTNWPGYMERVGNIAGPLLGYEVLTAFFLEATFLGVMLFGFRRVKPWVHTLATVLVAVGTTFSAFWILVLNSWMQTPVGFEMINGQAYPTDWMEIIFNPSMPYRLSHKLLASGLTAAFLLAGISAYRYWRGDNSPPVLATLKTGVAIAAVLIPVQIFVGDLHGLNTFEHQPQKVAAMEGVWETQKGADLLLFAIPDEENRTNHFEIGIPKLGSLILTHDWDGEIKGLNEFIGEHPPVTVVFYSFRVMVGIGVLMLLVAWWGGFELWRNKKPSNKLVIALMGMTFSGWIATLAGWYVTEIGRQPYIVYNLLTVDEAVGPVTGGMVGITLAMYLSVYALLMVAYITTLYYLAGKAQDDEISAEPEDESVRRSATAGMVSE